MRLGRVEQGEGAALRIEAMHARLQADREQPVVGRHDPADLARRGPALGHVQRRVEAVDRMALDIDEPQGRLAFDPDRPFAQYRPDRQDAARCGVAHISASRRR
jgi:hypothetical protein